MDAALAAFGRLVDYEVADVTAAATFYMAEIYSEFSRALLTTRSGPSDLDPRRAAASTSPRSKARPSRSRSARSTCTRRTSS